MFYSPAGNVDRLFDAARLLREAEAETISLLSQARYQEVIVPVLEREEVFASESMIRFVDRHGEVMGLRADFTGPLARVVATRLRGEHPVRLCYRGTVFRDVDARSGGRRQLHQAGFELFGDDSIGADIEVIRLTLRLCQQLGLGDVKLALGSAEIVSALEPHPTPEIRSALDRRDPSALSAALLPLLEFAGDRATLERARRELNPAVRPALDRLDAIVEGLKDDAERVVIDLAQVRPWTYYTGVVFDVYSPGIAHPVGGGGRYDSLVSRFGKARPAIGASLALDSLVAWHRVKSNAPLGPSPLTIALPKGRVRNPVLQRLGEWAPENAVLESRKLKVSGKSAPQGGPPFSFALVKDPDIPAYVEHGAADVGIVGLDILEEQSADVFRPVVTNLGRCQMCLCGPPGTDPEGLAASGSLRVATKYPNVARQALDKRGLPAEIIVLQGSVELSIVTGLADVIVDLVETGATLRANGLVILQEVFVSTARVIVNRASWRLRSAEVRAVLDRLGDAATKTG